MDQNRPVDKLVTVEVHNINGWFTLGYVKEVGAARILNKLITHVEGKGNILK